MDVRERIEAFWAGEKPDRIPLTMYHWFAGQDGSEAEWQALYDRGLGATVHVGSVHETNDYVENIEQPYEQNGQQGVRRIMRTPRGEISATWLGGWHRKYWLETPDDYRVMTDIVSHARLEPRYDDAKAAIAGMRPWEIALIGIGRTPIQSILVDFAGLEQFGVHLFEYEAEVRELYEAMLVNVRRRFELVASGPGRYVALMENFTAETLGPKRFDQFIAPVYDELIPLLQATGKVVGCHFDGKVRSCAESIRRSPLDVIESFTGPPDGDTTLAQGRSLWPTKKFWAHLNVNSYHLPAAELRSLVQQAVRDGAPDGRGLAFEISEDLPTTWRESIPVVLDALAEAPA